MHYIANEISSQQIDEMLARIPADISWDEWRSVAVGLSRSGYPGAEQRFYDWSQGDSRFKQGEARSLWKSAKKSNGSVASLVFIAKQYGYEFRPDKNQSNSSTSSAPTPVPKPKPKAKKTELTPANDLWTLFNRYAVKSTKHKYLTKKSIKLPAGALIVFAGDVKRVIGYSPRSNKENSEGKRPYLDGALLVIPVFSFDGHIQSFHFIDGNGNKSNLADYPIKDGYFRIGNELQPDYSGVINVAEGVATVASINACSGITTYCGFGDRNCLNIIKKLKVQFPFARVVLATDISKTRKKPHLLSAFVGEYCAPEIDIQEGSDFNDQMLAHGKQAVIASLGKIHTAIKKQVIKSSFNDMVAEVKTIEDAENTIKRVADRLGWKMSIDDVLKPFKTEWHDDLRQYAEWLLSRRYDDYSAHKALFTSKKMTMTECVEYISNHRKGCYFIRGDMGCGKSYLLAKPLLESSNKATVITYSQSLVTDFVNSKVVGFTDYRDVDVSGRNPPNKLVTCINSTLNQYIDPVIEQSDFICVDESAHVIDVLHQVGGTMESAAKSISDAFFNTVKNAPFSLLMDANNNNLILEIVRSYGIEPAVIDIVSDKVNCKVSLTALDDLYDQLRTALNNKKRVCVVSTSATELNVYLTEWLNKYFPELKYEILNGKSGYEGTDGQKWIMSNPDVACFEYDLIGISPIAEAGFSINTDCFDECFSIFEGGKQAEDCAQLMRRVRRATHWTTAIKGNGLNPDKTANDRLNESLYSAHLDCALTRGLPAALQNYDVHSAMLAGRKSAIKAFYGQNIYFELCDRFSDVSGTCGNPSPEFLTERTELKRVASCRLADNLNQAKQISFSEKSRLERKSSISIDESRSVLAFDVKETLFTEVIESDHVDLMNADIAFKAKNMMLAKHGLTNKDIERSKNDNVMNTSITHRKNVAARSQLISEIVLIMRGQGLDIVNGMGSINADTALEVFHRVANSPLKPALKTIKANADKLPAYPVRWVNSVLSSFGLCVERENHRDTEYTVKRDVKRSKAGTLKVPGHDLMMRLVDAKHKTLIKNGIEFQNMDGGHMRHKYTKSDVPTVHELAHCTDALDTDNVSIDAATLSFDVSFADIPDVPTTSAHDVPTDCDVPTAAVHDVPTAADLPDMPTTAVHADVPTTAPVSTAPAVSITQTSNQIAYSASKPRCEPITSDKHIQLSKEQFDAIATGLARCDVLYWNAPRGRIEYGSKWLSYSCFDDDVPEYSDIATKKRIASFLSNPPAPKYHR